MALASRIYEKRFERSLGGLSPQIVKVNERKKGRNSANNGGDQMDGSADDKSSYDLDFDSSYPMATLSGGLCKATRLEVPLYATRVIIM